MQVFLKAGTYYRKMETKKTGQNNLSGLNDQPVDLSV
jgi:hypothetical protein